MTALERLQDLLRSLFQYDLSDLDFGIYRLLRLKRDEIEAFLTEQLPRTVDEAFAAQAAEGRRNAEERLAALAGRVRREIADDALEDDGSIAAAYADQKARAVRALLDEYQAARAACQNARAGDEARAEVFNHLYAFFSRYYEDGDFIPRRFYGVPERYAVPYNGEETFFTWANRDQHYVKSGERFRDYAFGVPTLAGEYRVRFKLAEASATPGNGKGATRWFFPLPDQLEWDPAGRALCIPFAYRPPTDEETKAELARADGKAVKGQEAVIAQAEPRLRAAIADDTLATALGKPANGQAEAPSLLLKRLRHFVKRNTTDFFIHKDLRGFLERELEFYLKDQFLSVDDLHGELPARLQALRALRRVAADLIRFLAQIEDFQKRVFEKRKLVLRTDYLAPVSRVPSVLWPEVLRNKRQLEEWSRLYAIHPSRTLANPSAAMNDAFLQEHPGLVIDTALFDDDFTIRLLDGAGELDAVTDGILIHGENYQALRLLSNQLASRVKCTYIDPPYNTGIDEFIYKDAYQHSCWLTMMQDRLTLGRDLLGPLGLFFASIDFVEVAPLRLLCDQIWGNENFLADIAWEKRYTRSNNAKRFYSLKDTILTYRKSDQVKVLREPRTEKADALYSNPDNDPNGPWLSSSYVNPATKERRANLVYPIQHPVTGEKVEHESHAWKYEYEVHRKHVEEDRLYWGKDGTYKYPRLKNFLSEAGGGLVPVDVWAYRETGTTDEGGQNLKALFGGEVFDNPKPPRLIQRMLALSSALAAEEEIVLDYFAGSGSTGHAVVNLNRMDGLQRKFILVEMAEYFHSVLLPRIQKVVYSPDWRDGKPVRAATQEEVERGPRLVKVIRLESYEDALHNLTTEAEEARGKQRAAAAKAAVGADAFRLTYLLRLSPETGDSLLNLAQFEHPFDYWIEVLTDAGPRRQTVDLVETFNYLAGLRVRRSERWTNPEDGEREYRAVLARNREGQAVLVLWRDMGGLDPARERAFLEQRIAAAGPFDRAWINGDSATPGVASLDREFVTLMEAPVE